MDKKSGAKISRTSYRFIEGYEVVAKPLSDLLRKDVAFVFGNEQQASLQQLKASLVSAPVLRLYIQSEGSN